MPSQLPDSVTSAIQEIVQKNSQHNEDQLKAAIESALNEREAAALRAAALICKRASDPHVIFDTAPSIDCPAKVAKLFEITTELILALRSPDAVRTEERMRIQARLDEASDWNTERGNWHGWALKRIDDLRAQLAALDGSGA